jgi:hypothetical protein
VVSETKIKLFVYRRLDDGMEGLPENSPRALELHNLRKAGVHAALDDRAGMVQDWGALDDERPHELVEITLVAAAGTAFQYAIVPVLGWLSRKLVEQAFDTTVSECVKYLIAKLMPAQQQRQFRDFQIELPDGTRISVDPPDGGATLDIKFAAGGQVTINYLALPNEPETAT